MKVREWKKLLHANGNQKKPGRANLLSDKIYVKIKIVARDTEGHNIMIKGSIPKEDITIVNIYAPNLGEPQYKRQTPIKEEIDSNTIKAGEINTPLTPMNRWSRQKINKETQAWKDKRPDRLKWYL